MSDPGKYRTLDELEERKKNDALYRARTQLEQHGFSPDRLESLEQDVEREVQDAVEFADQSPEPDPSLLAETTYDGPFAA